MADIAPKLVELSVDKLRSLHERLHKSEATPATIEVHHLTTTEMLRRGMERPADDAWDEFEIQVDYVTDVDLNSFSNSLPLELIQEVIKETGSSIGNVRLLLTTDGYQMRIDPIDEDVNKMLRQENGKWTVYNEDGTRKFGTYSTKADAEKRLAQMHQFSKADNTPPKAVRDAARRALDWIADGKAGGGFTSVGRTRAGQLASGENISIETLKRMKSFFARHEVDKNALGFSQGEKGYPSAGRVAWDAWGGDAGYAWAESMVARAEKDEKVAKHNPGQHDQKTHGSWADGIAEAINRGEHPKVEAENVSAFLMSAAKRTDHPDLTELSVEGTLLFGDEGKGIARKDMPQIPGKERARFLAEIEQSDGITATAEEVDPKTLKPIQKEISSARSGAIYNKFREDGGIPQKERILISSDGFVVDGHHTWGASVGFAFDNPGTTLPVYRLSVTADEAMDISLKWSTANGFEGQAIDAPAKKSLTWKPLTKHEDHDQSTHGSWANSGSPKLTIMGQNDGVNEFFNERTRVVRYQPEGKEPTDYVLYIDGLRGDTVHAIKKPTDGTTIDGWSSKSNRGVVGHLDTTRMQENPWRKNSNDGKSTIVEVSVSKPHQRRGLASAMLRFHRDMFPEQDLQHSDALLPDGQAWAEVVKHGSHNQKTHGSWANGELAADKAPLKSRSADAVREASNLRKQSEAVEPSITGLMQNIGEQVGGSFAQLHQRLKSTDSLARKIDADAEKQYGGDRAKAASEISDAIRYTMTVQDDGYTDAVLATTKALEANGFKIRTKNFWESGDPYDGVNIKAEKNGVKVEIQLHTPASLKTKTKELHDIYEVYRKEKNNSKRESSWNEMVKIARKIPRPAKMDVLLSTPTLTMQEFETAEQAGLSKSTLVDIMEARGGQA
jgi:hypothetical protein